MKHTADYYRVYFILIVILSGVQLSAFAQDSLPYPVILSSRWFHPTSPQDTLSTIRMVELYHPDRIDWMYCTNADQLAQLKRRQIPYSLAINPQVPDSSGYTAKGRVVDLNGNKLVAPWMQNWKQKNANWGCVNSPEFKKVFFDQSCKLVDLGAYGLFVDDARFNDHAVEWGGCFCEYCMKGFSKFLHAEAIDSLGASFNYRDYLHKHGISTAPVKGKGQKVPLWNQFQRFQTQSVIQFLKSWRTDVKTYAKRPVTFLTNNYGGRWTEIYQVFDVGIAELPENKINADFIQKQVETAKSLGKQQYFTLSSDVESDQLRALFLTFSVGSSLIIPWDVYVNNKSKQFASRYYGKFQSFQPIYNLFRSNNDKSLQVGYQNKSLRKKVPFIITSGVENDSISIYGYKSTASNVVMIKSTSFRKGHFVKLQAENTDIIKNIRVLYPDKKAVKVKYGGTKMEIMYNEDVLVISTNIDKE